MCVVYKGRRGNIYLCGLRRLSAVQSAVAATVGGRVVDPERQPEAMLICKSASNARGHVDGDDDIDLPDLAPRGGRLAP